MKRVILLLATSLFLASFYITHASSTSTEPKIIFQPDQKIETLASSTCVFDVENQKVIYSDKGYDILPLASITKLMTALAASTEFSETRIVKASLVAIISIEKWKLIDLTQIMITASSNQAAFAIEKAYNAKSSISLVQNMNMLAQELGLPDLKFYNSTGLDVSKTKSGGYGSACSVAQLITILADQYPKFFAASKNSLVIYQSENKVLYTAKNTNIITDNMPDMVASKTGYTPLANGNLTVAINIQGHKYGIAVLGSTQSGRFTDVQKIYDFIEKSVKMNR